MKLHDYVWDDNTNTLEIIHCEKVFVDWDKNKKIKINLTSKD